MTDTLTDTFQVVFPGIWRPVVERWLESRDLYLAGPIPGLEDDLPTFFLGIPGRTQATEEDPVRSGGPKRSSAL